MCKLVLGLQLQPYISCKIVQRQSYNSWGWDSGHGHVREAWVRQLLFQEDTSVLPHYIHIYSTFVVDVGGMAYHLHDLSRDSPPCFHMLTHGDIDFVPRCPSFAMQVHRAVIYRQNKNEMCSLTKSFRHIDQTSTLMSNWL